MSRLSDSPYEFNALLIDVIRANQDGFAIFDQQDVLIFCNHGFASNFSLRILDAEGLTFADILRKSHASGAGIQIGSDNIEAFIRQVMTTRREQGFRSFESHLTGGRWIKVSRLITQDGYLFVYSTDITKLKNTEAELRRALSDVKQLAATDPLTGISNRRHFLELARVEFERSRRYGHSLSLLTLDIDHFKAINDNYGHQTGDRVLKALTTSCRQLLRSSDLFARQGGEEFAILLPDTDQGAAVITAERIRQTIAAISVDYQQQTISLTTSIGLATLCANTENLDQLMNQADKALYRAKNSGRNRCEIWR